MIKKFISRRDFLKTTAALGAGAVTWGTFPQLANASTLGNGTKVLFLNLNGGLDGVYALQPGSGAVYSTLASIRPTLSIAPSSLLDARYGFGFNPNLPLFKSLFDAQELSAVLGVGYENMSRSHLDSEVVMARGVPNRLTAAQSGFLNRLGAHYGWSSLNAVSVTGTDLAFEGGDYRGVQARSLEDFYFRGFASGQERNHLANTAYSISADSIPDPTKTKMDDFSKNFQLAVDNIDSIKGAVQAFQPVGTYPQTQFGKALKDLDILYSSPSLQTQVGYMRCSGFDTHSNQGPTLDRMLTELNASLSVFINSMKAKNLWKDMVVLVYSEFGRTNQENGSAGTDHGGANSMFLLGGAVKGGEIYGDLTSSDLTNFGWLQMKYNVVELYRRIIEKLGLDPDAVFAPTTSALLPNLFR